MWNRNYIDHIQITAAEDIGIGTRAAFYEQTGVVRDMVQNHLLQLLCMVAMEPPLRYDADSLRDETRKVLEAVKIPKDVNASAVCGQYEAGSIAGHRVAGDRDEAGVSKTSTVATFTALKLTLDSWRWADVPIYLRTGKRLSRSLTAVAIHFKPTPHLMFPIDRRHRTHHSLLVFEVQPNEGIDRAWQIVDPIVERWTSTSSHGCATYPAGSSDPAAVDRLIEHDGRRWRNLSSSSSWDGRWCVFS